MIVQWLCARTAVVALLALSACSDLSAPREDVGHASLALGVPPNLPVLGAYEAGWRFPPTRDFNGDGLHDLMWRDHPNHRVAVSLMSGTRILEQGPFMPGPPGGPDWMVVTAGSDFNRDGMEDVWWYNWTTHQSTVWLMAGTKPFVRGPMIPGPGEGWFGLPAGDLNGDGMSDWLWHNATTNRMAVWLMAGTEPFEHGPEIPGPGEGWLARFAADFDRDGMADVFWEHPTRDRMAVWLMNGTEVRQRGPELPTPPDPDWSIAGAGDFNADRMPDTIWFNKRTKSMKVLLMYGTELLEEGPEIPGPPGDGWIVGNAADCNGDGAYDVIWLNPSPLRCIVWLMKGAVPMLQGPEIPGPEGG
jgi:hypothetical protein